LEYEGGVLKSQQARAKRSDFARKTVVVNAKPRLVSGLSASDPYFASVVDNFEQDFALFCERYLRDDYNCFDIGANIGVTTMILSDFCPNGRIVSVEPNWDVYCALQENVQANALSNVTTVRSAIGDRNGTTNFSENSAFGHVVESGTIVPLMTVANLVAQSGLPHVDFVKIDVEGFEPIILRHAFDVLDAQRALIYLEFNSWCLIGLSKINPSEFLDWIFDKFASVFVVHRAQDGLLQKLTRSDALGFLYGNLLKYGCVNDLVVTNDAQRLDYSATFVEKRFLAMQVERDAAVADQHRLQAERIAAIASQHQSQAERDAAIASQHRLQAERDALAGERDALAVMLRSATAERDDLAGQIDALHKSSSWRLTAPLRRVRAAFARTS